MSGSKEKVKERRLLFRSLAVLPLTHIDTTDISRGSKYIHIYLQRHGTQD